MTDNPTERTSAIAHAFAALYDMVLYLRGEHGCPWDRKQDLKSMHGCLCDEILELGEEIEKNDNDGISEEWGDVFFILIMLAVIGEETGRFNPGVAMRSVETKMIRRHPHVFGSAAAGAVEDALMQWESVKAREKDGESDSLMDSIPQFYSALRRADHVQKAAADVGFDWPERKGVLEKIEEEIGELHEALATGNTREAAAELGDLLFSCVNLARFEKMDAESLLGKTIDKFIDRFKYIESELRRVGKSPNEVTLGEMDALWEKSKTEGDCSDPLDRRG